MSDDRDFKYQEYKYDITVKELLHAGKRYNQLAKELAIKDKALVLACDNIAKKELHILPKDIINHYLKQARGIVSPL